MRVRLPVDPDGRVALAHGRPVYLTEPNPEDFHRADWASRAARPGEAVAFRVTPEQLDQLLARPGVETGTIRDLTGDPAAARALGLLYHRENTRFDPLDGTRLTYDAEGRVARSERGHLVFPQLKPAVIGAVLLDIPGEKPRVLVAKNRNRPGYHSLIAGYIEAGETAEQAFVREVREETARRVEGVSYHSSQPWPASGSIMFAFTATTTDREPIGPVDGEVFDLRWLAADELGQVTLPAPGSIARDLIDAFARGRLE